MDSLLASSTGKSGPWGAIDSDNTAGIDSAGASGDILQEPLSLVSPH